MTIEEARAAYVADKITLDEYEIAIKDAVQLHSASAVTNLLPKKAKIKLPSIRFKRKPRSRGRTYIGVWTHGWLYLFVCLQTLVDCSIVGHDILRHRAFTNVLGVGIILTGVLVGIWMIVSAIIYAATEFD